MSKHNNTTKYISVKEAAGIVSCNPRTISRLIKDGVIPAIYINTIHPRVPADFVKYLEVKP